MRLTRCSTVGPWSSPGFTHVSEERPPQSAKKLGLDDAYAVRTPDDNRALYRDWADTYDSEFVAARGYVYAEEVARHFVGALPEAAQPLLDVGCGTGLVGVSLDAAGFGTIDGIDISPEMLDQAGTKGVYRRLSEMDVTEPLPIESGTYAGVTSAGTFTHGHLGPEPIRELVRITAPGAPLAIGINAEHFEAEGFGRFLDELVEVGAVTELRLERIPMYDQADDEHGADEAVVAIFTRA